MRTILVTLGDPCGLGPELCCRVLPQAALQIASGDRILLLGPLGNLRLHLDGAAPFWTVLDTPTQVSEMGPGIYGFQPVDTVETVGNGVETVGKPGRVGSPGKMCVEGGRAAGQALDLAVELLNAGAAQGLLTCPLHKAMLQQAGFDFPGHTEFLAQGSGVGVDNICMHLGGPRLRVSLVTTHPRLRDVPDLITEERILTCLRLTREHLDRLGPDHPGADGPIGVCGLNPHAGESGRIGDEEVRIIGPAVEKANKLGFNAIGPLPADSLFHFAAKGDYGAVLAMYHDQGLGPLKLLHFSEAVNVTLGLPWPRTSPDHGTGYDLVGTGKASTDSFRAALDMLLQMLPE